MVIANNEMTFLLTSDGLAFKSSAHLGFEDG